MIVKNKISACIVAYNEEKVIERCLKSINDIVDEIILVHDGECSDNTLEIGKRYGAKIFVKEHHGSAEKHRIFAFNQTSNEWILHIDSDEFLSDKARNEILNLVDDPKYDAYAFNWPTYDGTKYIKGCYSIQPRVVLLRKSKMYYIAITNDAPKTYGNLCTRLDIIMEHKPLYNNLTFKSLRNKWIKWSKIQAKEIISIDNIDTFNISKDKSHPIYKYYYSLIKHPYLELIKRYIIYDVIKKLLYGKLFPNTLTTFKIMIINYINVLYLAHYISYFKMHNEEATL